MGTGLFILVGLGLVVMKVRVEGFGNLLVGVVGAALGALLFEWADFPYGALVGACAGAFVLLAIKWVFLSNW